MAIKKFKDPIYGYITVSTQLINSIIDTSAFQRLRDIIQTSYSPLYSSALHNRFAHSMGVYHLGKIAAHAFYGSLSNDSLQKFPDIKSYIEIFEIACLLHDVGHAPFSHTGEKFYLLSGERKELHNTLVELTGDAELEKEIEDNSYKAAPHELMSAIVSLQNFGEIIQDEQRSFFARCICGYKYVNEMNEQKSLLNCLVELLNSKIIDVDKLDYLLRDAYMTGFNTVSIDYMRLLDNICAEKSKDGYYEICYNKSAVSVIENVVYAHDAERKWIQNHPIVLYEAHIIEEVMQEIIHVLLKRENLSSEFLSEKGVEVEGLGKIRLMGDSDVLFLMKNLPLQGNVSEYYERKQRKHPIWKSETEFQAIFQGNEKELELIKDEFENLKDYLRSQGLPFLIDKKAMDICREEVEELEKELQNAKDLERTKIMSSLKTRKEHIQWMEILEDFAKNQGIKFEFLIIYADQFNSGFRKREFGNIQIIFPELKEPCKFGEVSNVLKSDKSKGEKFFFLYYAREEGAKEISITDLVKKMLILAGNILVQTTINQRLV